MNTPAGGKQPSTWDDYERGGGSPRGSVGSIGSHVHWPMEGFERHHSNASSHNHLGLPEGGPSSRALRERKSSMSMRINSIRYAGGVNSIDRFAQSWQRAAGFHEITPQPTSFRFADDADADIEHSPEDEEEGTPTREGSRLRSEYAIEEPSEEEPDEEDVGPTEETPILSHRHSGRDSNLPFSQRRRSHAADSIFTIEPSLASIFGGSYGTQYGSLAAHVNESSMRHAGRLFTEQQLKGVTEPDKEREPLLVKQIVEDDKVINVVVGQSTLPQTVFNSVNVLIGIGLLSLPLALRYSGWLIGMIFFVFAALSTQYTAKILAKCLDVDNSLITFADLAYVSFGPKARLATSVLFCLELIAACVALVVLFADSLDALVPDFGLGVLGWKVICGFILVPLAFLPLRLLSFTSVLGILCCFGIVLAVLVDGLIKSNAPGSLRDPVKTWLFPAHWGTVPLSFGLFMAPWGGHSVFPNIYRDMRHPYKYRKGLNVTYFFTFFLDVTMAIVGYIMFGDGVRDEITSNILMSNKGYPQWISVFIVVCIAIIPLTKVPLNARPIISTIEILLSLDPRALSPLPSTLGMSGFNRGLLKITIRILTTTVFIVLAILVPSFDRIMTLMGSVACFSICIILPCGFHLKLFGKDLGRWEWWGNWVLLGVSMVMAVVSTLFACLPKDLIGAE